MTACRVIVCGRRADRQQKTTVRRQIDIVGRYGQRHRGHRPGVQVDGAETVAALVRRPDGPPRLAEVHGLRAGLPVQPCLHFGDLAFLRFDDPGGPSPCFGIVPILLHDLRHGDGALMVRDHAPHEGRVGIVGHDAFHHRPVHRVHGVHIGAGEIGKGLAGMGRIRRSHHPLHHAALHHLLHGVHAFGGHALHHGPALLGHARHDHRSCRGCGSLIRLRRWLRIVVGIMPGLGQRRGRQRRHEADGKSDCSSFHLDSTRIRTGSGVLCRARLPCGC